MKIGDKVTTSYNRNCPDIVRTVLAVFKQKTCRSGIMVVVDHPKEPGYKDLQLDMAWFQYAGKT